MTTIDRSPTAAVHPAAPAADPAGVPRDGGTANTDRSAGRTAEQQPDVYRAGHVSGSEVHPASEGAVQRTALHRGTSRTGRTAGRTASADSAPRGVDIIRAARRWPAFEQSTASKFWINALLTVVAVAASYGAALGQAGFAEMYLGMHGPERFVVFLIIEATAVALMLLANQTALAGDSAGGLWALVWAVTAGAVTMQVIHANAIGQPEAAMVYATASVLTVILWRAKTRRSLRDRLRAAGMIEDPLPRYRPVRWALRPRETFRAWYLALGEGVSDPATAMDMSRADSLYHRSVSAARRAIRRSRKTSQTWPDLSGQRHVVPPWRVTHPAAAMFGVQPWHRHEPAALGGPPRDTSAVQGVPRTADVSRAVPSDTVVRTAPRPAVQPVRTADVPRDSGTPAAAGRHGAAEGTAVADTVSRGTQTVPRDSGTPAAVVEGEFDAQTLRIASHIIAVADTFEDWYESLPSVRKARDAMIINSMSTAQKVVASMRQLAELPDPRSAIDALRPIAEPD